MNYNSLPKWAWDTVREVAVAHSDDISLAVSRGLAALRKNPEYDDLIDKLVEQCVRDMVYDVRHRITVQAKYGKGIYGKAPKTDTANSAVLGEVHRGLFDRWFIGGTLLGDLTGGQLEDLLGEEYDRADGHLLNARILKWLRAQKIPSDTKVRDFVPEKKMEEAFERLKDRGGSGPAASAARTK